MRNDRQINRIIAHVVRNNNFLNVQCQITRLLFQVHCLIFGGYTSLFFRREIADNVYPCLLVTWYL